MSQVQHTKSRRDSLSKEPLMQAEPLSKVARQLKYYWFLHLPYSVVCPVYHHMARIDWHWVDQMILSASAPNRLRCRTPNILGSLQSLYCNSPCPAQRSPMTCFVCQTEMLALGTHLHLATVGCHHINQSCSNRLQKARLICFATSIVSCLDTSRPRGIYPSRGHCNGCRERVAFDQTTTFLWPVLVCLIHAPVEAATLDDSFSAAHGQYEVASPSRCVVPQQPCPYQAA